MKLEQFAREYGLNYRAVNGLYDLKKRADRGEYPHDSDPRVRRLFDNNIEKALIIVVKAHLEYQRDRDNPNVSRRLPMLWRCSGIGRITVTNIIEAVYAYLDDPKTPDTVEMLQPYVSVEPKQNNNEKKITIEKNIPIPGTNKRNPEDSNYKWQCLRKMVELKVGESIKIEDRLKSTIKSYYLWIAEGFSGFKFEVHSITRTTQRVWRVK